MPAPFESIREKPVVVTNTGSTTRKGNRCSAAKRETSRTVDAWPSIPVLTARGVRSFRTASICASTIESDNNSIPVTEVVFCAVTAVIAVAANTFLAFMALMSAWIPAPPPESEPAMLRTTGGCMGTTLPVVRPSDYAGGMNSLKVGTFESASRLVVGTGGFRTMELLEQSLRASESSLATVALRRVEPGIQGSIYELLAKLDFTLLPNTAGCFTAAEAVKTAELAREAFETNLIKLEVIGDDITLLPDTSETLIAAHQLVEKGFEVWVYTSDDLISALRLEQAGCVAVMPLGSPIGSGLGIRNPHAIASIAERLLVPVLLDAGIGTASDAALAMELGCAGVLAASAINRALDPVLMAAAIRDGVRAGYAAAQAGRIPPRLQAEASSSNLGRPDLFAN